MSLDETKGVATRISNLACLLIVIFVLSVQFGVLAFQRFQLSYFEQAVQPWWERMYKSSAPTIDVDRFYFSNIFLPALLQISLIPIVSFLGYKAMQSKLAASVFSSVAAVTAAASWLHCHERYIAEMSVYYYSSPLW